MSAVAGGGGAEAKQQQQQFLEPSPADVKNPPNVADVNDISSDTSYSGDTPRGNAGVSNYSVSFPPADRSNAVRQKYTNSGRTPPVAPAAKPNAPANAASVSDNPPSNIETALQASEQLMIQNPENEKLKNMIIILQKNLLHKTLEDMKKNKDITSQEYKKFEEEVNAAGLTLTELGPDQRQGVTRGLLGMVSIPLQERLKDVKIEDGGVAFKAALQKAVDSKTSLSNMILLRDYVISKTGRENGPDIALKVIPSIKDEDILDKIKKIINENSSITEVMNILAFLLNNKQQREGSIVYEFSVESGIHDNNGKYTTQPSSSSTDKTNLKTVFASLTGGDSPFDIKTFKAYSPEYATQGGKLPSDEIILPQGILRRNPATYNANDPIVLKREDIPKVISACVLQMVNILENTRQVFGGWAKLFKGMQGGSSKPKNKSKKTRRRYRRRN